MAVRLRRGEQEVAMLKALWLTILLIFGAWPANLAAQERYLISYNGFGMGQAPVWATKDLGLFAKYGLNTDVVMISGSAPATQALVGGSTHFAQTDGTPLITSKKERRVATTLIGKAAALRSLRKILHSWRRPISIMHRSSPSLHGFPAKACTSSWKRLPSETLEPRSTRT
jgi:hypothetical protein